MLQSITTLIETAMVAGSTAATGSTAVKIEKDDKGKATGIMVNKKRSIAGTLLSSTATTGTYIGQELSYQDTLNNVKNAQAYVESMSDEELAHLDMMLTEKDAEFAESNDKVKSTAKVYVKKQNSDKKTL